MTMRLNPDTLALAAHLDAQAGADASVSAREMASFGKKLSAAKAKRSAPAKTKRKLDILGWLGGVVKKGSTIAQAAGVALPFDRDILRLDGMKRELSSLRFQMDEILSRAIPRLYAKKNARADLMAQNLRTAASRAKAQLVAATKALDAAQAAAQEGRRVVAAGKLPAQASGVFLVKKSQADAQYSAAKKRAMSARALWQTSEEALAREGVPTARDFARAGSSSVTEFAARTGSALREVGEVTSQAAEGVVKGARAAAPVVKYWPIAAVVLGSVYVLTILPKPSSKE